MKYVVLSLNGVEDLFTFPPSVEDQEIMDACLSIRFGDRRNWSRKYHEAKVVAAGTFVDGQTSGGSLFLGAESRGDVDNILLRALDSKYIMVALDKDSPEIFTFPKAVDHDRMAEACEMIRFGHDLRCNEKHNDGEILSAGFVSGGSCHGRSETLSLASRGKIDTDILKRSLASNSGLND